MLLYIIAAEVLASFINANKRIKEIQIGDHEIEIVNFADNTTIFLRDVTCLNRIQGILKMHLAQRQTFQKVKPLHNLKILGVIFGNSILDNFYWDKISEGIVKNPYLEQSETLFER